MGDRVPPLPDIQRETIDKLWNDHTNLNLANVGDKWWLISSKWINSWREYVRWDKRQSSSRSVLSTSPRLTRFDSFGNEPGPIENFNLSNPKHPEALSDTVQEMRDYELIDDVLWKKFTEWYPCKKVFGRKVIEQGEGSRKIRVVELRPPRFQLYVASSSTDQNEKKKKKCTYFTLSRNDTGKTLSKEVKDHINVDFPDVRIWISGGHDVSVPPKTLDPCQWIRVPNDNTSLYELGVMGMKNPLLVLAEFRKSETDPWIITSSISNSSDVLNKQDNDDDDDDDDDEEEEEDDATWRANLKVGSLVDFETSDGEKKSSIWREARIVEVNGNNLVVHCLGWLNKTSDLFRVQVSRDSNRVSRSHSHVRDWREQLRVRTPVEVHKSLICLSNDDDDDDGVTFGTKRPIYRCTTAKDPKGTDEIKTYYIHYVNGEWWLGAKLNKPHGYLYIKSYSRNPMELGGGGGGEVEANDDADGVFKYDDDHKTTRETTSDVKENHQDGNDLMFDDSILETKSTSESWLYWDMEAPKGSSTWVKDPCLRVVDMSSSATKKFDDEYPDAIMLVGHEGIQKGRMKEVYTRYVPASELNAKSSWKRATVKRIDFKNDKIDLSVRISDSYYSYNNFKTIRNLELNCEKICMEGTHLVKDNDISDSYADDIDKNVSNKFGAGVVGLRNLGNTCYMNAMLQCMFASRDLCAYFMEDELDINLTNVLGTGGQVAKAFQRLVRAAWSGHADVVTPKDFKTVFGRFNSKFAGYAQQDSCEALGALMDNLHEDLNRVKKKPIVEPVDDEGNKSDVMARASWEGFKMRNNSVIVDKYFGQDKSELWCPDCMKSGKSRRKFDPRLTVLVSLPTVNTKVQEITLVRRGSGEIMKYGVTIPKKGGLGQDMAESLSKLCGIPATSLIILEAYSHKVYKTYYTADSSIPLSNILDQDIIIAYETLPMKRKEEEKDDDDKDTTPNDSYWNSTYSSYNKPKFPNDTGGNNLLQLLFGVSSTYSSYTQPDFFGQPLVISYPHGTTKAQLKNIVMDEIKHFFKQGEDKLPDETKLLVLKDETCSCGDKFQIDDESADNIFGLAIVFPDRSSCPIEKDVFEKVCEMHESCPTKKRGAAHQKPSLTLEKCLEATFEKERLGKADTWFCPDCRNHVRAYKKMELWSLADTMIMGLKRFSQIMGAWSARSEKNTTSVRIPAKIDMAPFVVGPQGDSKLEYELYAVTHHFGGLGGGHYTAYGKHGDRWFNFDDRSVSVLHDDVIDPRSAYVLFWRRVKEEEGGAK